MSRLTNHIHAYSDGWDDEDATYYDLLFRAFGEDQVLELRSEFCSRIERVPKELSEPGGFHADEDDVALKGLHGFPQENLGDDDDLLPPLVENHKE